ncbi:ABC transporter permease [Virgifigura deserti]|uniref:ABC transporter permease n=1 Tax=Virgifigura deserti TaxID=2268457 RepID=UPI003CCBC434
MPASDPIASAALPAGTAAPRGAGVFRQIARDPMGLLGLTLATLLVVTGLFADWLAPYDPIGIDVRNRFADPSWAHPLGTDNLGRDLLSRVIAGSQIALIVAFCTTFLAMIGGLVLGLIAGYGPRWLDNTLLLLFDSIYSFPYIMLALAVITLFGSSFFIVILVIAVTTLPAYARLVRTSTLGIKNSEFVLAERSLGARAPRILFRHIMPNILGPLLIIVSMDIPVVITVEAGLSFLGLGVPPPAPSWGRILNEGYSFIRQSYWIVIAGGLPLILATLGFTFLGESLRDIFDPKLRKRG